jgi:hypothetical protein
MKIDKAIWASSVEYSDFWNINSYIHNKYLGMDCVLLLYGNKDECDVSEEYGKVIEIPFVEHLPKIPQLIFNKWYYTKNEPNTTWLIGDIDQLPLQKSHFVDGVADIPEDHYVHLAEDAGTHLGLDFLVGHYHVGMGSTICEALELDKSFDFHVNNLVDEALRNKRPIWAYEEPYTTNMIRCNYGHKFTGLSRVNDRKICRSTQCKFDPSRIESEYYVDFHCPRPFKENSSKINEIINIFWGRKSNI